MNKKKRIAILFAVIIILAVGIIIAVASHQKKEMDFDEFADRFEKSAEEVLGEDVKKVSKTELAATQERLLRSPRQVHLLSTVQENHKFL